MTCATVVVATHDPALLRKVAGRQITLRSGRVVDGGAAQHPEASEPVR